MDGTKRRWGRGAARGGRLARRGLAGWAVFQLGKLALVGTLVVAGCGPIGPIPGGALSGEPGPAAVADWSFAAEIDTAQLETRPSDPHSVNVWFAWVGPALYVPSSMILGTKDPAGRGWVAHVAEDPRVRIRLGETVYPRRAVRVPDGSAEYRAARAALEARYALDPQGRDPARAVWIYRLDPRQPVDRAGLESP